MVEKSNLDLRRIRESDRKQIYDWANDPRVRESSFDNDPIGWSEHKEWFEERLHDDRTYFYIAEKNNEPVGQIRFEVNENAIVSISIDRNHRGEGLGTTILRLGTEKFLSQDNSTEIVHAWIKKGNHASCRAFEKAGYQRLEETTHKGSNAYHYTFSLD